MKSLLRKIKLLLKIALGKEILVYPDIKVNKTRFGSEYGGWEIIADNLNANAVIYSFGIGEDASFDVSLIEQYNLTVHAFDPTPRSAIWVRKQNFPKNFRFYDYGIADFDGEISFYPPSNNQHVSHSIVNSASTNNQSISVPVKKLSTIMNELRHNEIDILKMDIEGAEYKVIKEIEKSDIRPKQILVEFHHRFDCIDKEETRRAIASLNLLGYKLFSVSDTGQEYSFVLLPKSE